MRRTKFTKDEMVEQLESLSGIVYVYKLKGVPVAFQAMSNIIVRTSPSKKEFTYARGYVIDDFLRENGTPIFDEKPWLLIGKRANEELDLEYKDKYIVKTPEELLDKLKFNDDISLLRKLAACKMRQKRQRNNPNVVPRPHEAPDIDIIIRTVNFRKVSLQCKKISEEKYKDIVLYISGKVKHWTKKKEPNGGNSISRTDTV